MTESQRLDALEHRVALIEGYMLGDGKTIAAVRALSQDLEHRVALIEGCLLGDKLAEEAPAAARAADEASVRINYSIVGLDGLEATLRELAGAANNALAIAGKLDAIQLKVAVTEKKDG